MVTAWNKVNKKDKIEFKLRVAKRKNTEGASSALPSATSAATSGDGALATSQGPAASATALQDGDLDEQALKQLKDDVDDMKKKYQNLQQEKIR